MLQTMSMVIIAALVGLGIRAWGGGTSLGLLAVNVFGSLIAGFLGGLRLESPWVTAGILGFCGCLTTFSGFALENVRLLNQGDFFKASSNFFLHNALCLLLCYAGYLIAQKV
jgi:CrcB protein